MILILRINFLHKMNSYFCLECKYKTDKRVITCPKGCKSSIVILSYKFMSAGWQNTNLYNNTVKK